MEDELDLARRGQTGGVGQTLRHVGVLVCRADAGGVDEDTSDA